MKKNKPRSSINSDILAVFILVWFAMESCNPGAYTESLSANYVYEDRGPDARNIVCDSPMKSIYSEVIDYDYNKNFIIAVQKPKFKGYEQAIAFDLRGDLEKYPKGSYEDVVKSDSVADSILRCDPYYQRIFSHEINYWVISHKDNRIYGPLTKEEYLQKRKELKVPDRLKLKEL